MKNEKKERERRILRSAFPRISFMEERERPDFIIRSGSDPDPIGVEVTEFYPSESDARVERLPDYMVELLRGLPHRHKDDVHVLEIEHADEAPMMSRTVTRRMPDPSALVLRLAEQIVRKDALLRDSDAQVGPIVLVVLDRPLRPLRCSPGSYWKHMNTKRFRHMLESTVLSEVLFLTRDERERWMKIELRATLRATSIADPELDLRAAESIDPPVPDVPC